MSNRNDAIKQRVAKLLTLGRHPESPEAEVETALRLAAKLMREHGLSEADLAEQRQSPHVVCHLPYATSYGTRWLAAVHQHVFPVKIVNVSGLPGEWETLIFGPPSITGIVADLLAFTAGASRTAERYHAKKFRASHPRRKWSANAFFKGFGFGILHNLRAHYLPPTDSALVLCRQQAEQDAKQATLGRVEIKHRRPKIKRSAAMELGALAGAQTEVRRARHLEGGAQ